MRITSLAIPLFFCLGSAQANLLAPGASGVSPDVLTIGPGATLVGFTGPQTISTTIGTDTLSVTYFEDVFTDPSGLCPGCLDFLIQATNNTASTDIIDRVTTSNFGALGASLPDVGDNTSLPAGTNYGAFPAIGGAIAPTSLDRSSNGNVIGFDFAASAVSPGGNTEYLIIKTTATAFVPGTVSFQDGVTASGPGFGVAPEPDMIALLVLGLAGVVLANRRRKSVV
jgi:PEP-CTERM motif